MVLSVSIPDPILQVTACTLLAMQKAGKSVHALTHVYVVAIAPGTRMVARI